MGAQNTKLTQESINNSSNNSSKNIKKATFSNINISNNSVESELFEKIIQLSKSLYSSYQTEFLDPSFCKKLSTIYKKKLFELDIKSLKKIHNSLNNNNNSNKNLSAVLSYLPNEDEKFIVDEFKTDLKEYLWNQHIDFNPKIFESKGILVEDIPIKLIDPQNKLRYINTAHVNNLLSNSNHSNNSITQLSNSNELNNNSKNTLTGGANQNNSSSSFNQSISSSSNSSSSNSFSNSSSTSSPSLFNMVRNNQNINKNKNQNNPINNPINNTINSIPVNKNKNRNKNNKSNITSLQNKILNANRMFGFQNNQQNNQQKPLEQPLQQTLEQPLEQPLQQLPFKNNKRKENQSISYVVNNQNNKKLVQWLGEIENTGPSELPSKNNQIKQQKKKNVVYSVRNYNQPSSFCKSGSECSLTKNELCKSITEHFIVRGNIIASILSTLPKKTAKGFEGGYCYQRFLNLDKCQVCLPHNYNELMNMDIKTRIQTMMLYINYMTEKECNDNKGYFRKLTLSEKKSLIQNAKSGNEFNVLYAEYTQTVRQKYMEHLNLLLDILNNLSIMQGINNDELNQLSLKTREIIDSMYHLCQFYYLYAIIALLNSNIEPLKKEENLEKNKIKNNLRKFLSV